MPAYSVDLTSHARRRLAKLPRDAQERLAQRIDQLRDDPRGSGEGKLSGREGQYKTRAGSYRALYEVDDEALLVTVVEILPRSDVYRPRRRR